MRYWMMEDMEMSARELWLNDRMLVIYLSRQMPASKPPPELLKIYNGKQNAGWNAGHSAG